MKLDMEKRHLSISGERLARYWDRRNDDHLLALHGGGAANLARYTPRRNWQRRLPADVRYSTERMAALRDILAIVGGFLGAIALAAHFF